MQVNRLRFAHRGFKNPFMWKMDKIIKRFFNLDSFRMVKTDVEIQRLAFFLTYSKLPCLERTLFENILFYFNLFY